MDQQISSDKNPKTPTTPASIRPFPDNLSQRQKDTVTLCLLLLAFIFPPLGAVGIILMWTWTSWKKWLKILITLPLIIGWFLVAVALFYVFIYLPKNSYQYVKDGKTQHVPIRPITSTAEVKIGDYIVYSPSDDSKTIKRILGLPGSSVRVSNGSLFVNGNLMGNTYRVPDNALEGQEIIVPEGHYFTIGGDNSTKESIETSIIREEDIKGVVYE